VVHSDCQGRAPLPVSPSHVNSWGGAEMVQKIVRCPYCVFENDFREMVSHLDGRVICRKCGHIAMPANPDFKCVCPKCWEMSFPTSLAATRGL
jgi:hypothetical protein